MNWDQYTKMHDITDTISLAFITRHKWHYYSRIYNSSALIWRLLLLLLNDDDDDDD